jgi:hypothetical protein
VVPSQRPSRRRACRVVPGQSGQEVAGRVAVAAALGVALPAGVLEVAVEAVGGEVVKKLPVRAVDLDEEYSMEGKTARTPTKRRNI